MIKAKFLAFEKVRLSGETNMYDINEVIRISIKYGQILTKEECFDIMVNYDKYKQKYGTKNRK